MDTKATEAEVDACDRTGPVAQDRRNTHHIRERTPPDRGNYPWKNLQQLINGELNYQKTAQNAGEKVLRAENSQPAE